MRMMEVRCCCQPKKVLGWLPVPDDVEEGMTMAYAGVSRLPSPTDLWMDCAPVTCKSIPVVQLKVARIAVGESSWLAMKGEGMTVEQLRTLVRFEESR